MDKQGFTLIELLIVIAIIGILSIAATTAYVGTIKKAARSEGYSSLEVLRLLEEQFYAENGIYTQSLGAAGNTVAIRDNNVDIIQDKANDADIHELPGFKPGKDSQFSFRIVGGSRLADNLHIPLNSGDIVALASTDPPCFVAVATGVINTRVEGDIFAIDCNNNKNF